MTNPSVYQALSRLKRFLESRHANVLLIYLPHGEAGTKQGIDDFLAIGEHTIDDALALATPKLKEPPSEDDASPYERSDSGFVWHKSTGDGTVPIPLSNFPAEITADTIIDDGVEQTREFSIQAKLKGCDISFSIPASQYPSLAWISEHLGAEALLYPAISLKDHAQFAIQSLSSSIEKRTLYAHLDWRNIGGDWVYLHAGGHIGQDGQVFLGETQLQDPLARYVLPEPPTGDVLRQSIHKSMQCLDVFPHDLTIPLYGCIWRAVFPFSGFSAHLCGQTGNQKTAYSAVLQQHFGAEMDAAYLPANWTSSANALEALAFSAKDALMVVGEFTPTDSVQSQALHRTAERLFRAAANGSSRQRMNRDTTLRPAKPPRCLVLSTGEDIPYGSSLRSRMIILEVEPKTVRIDGGVPDVGIALLTRFKIN
jgi:hypothetical protein